MMKAIIALMLMAMICGASFILATADGDPPSVPSAPQPVTTEDGAFALALKYTGFSKLAGFSTAGQPQPELVTITDDQTPFLHEKINGKPIWRVRFDNVVLPGKVPDTSSGGTHLRKFEVLLDPATGQLLKIISKSDVIDTNIAPEPPVERAEQELRLGGQMYHAFVFQSNALSFLDAYNACRGRAASAGQMTALLVMFSQKNFEGYEQPKPIWDITLRGIPPHIMPAPRNAPELPLYLSNYEREVIDATTGKMLFSTNIPSVEPRK